MKQIAKHIFLLSRNRGQFLIACEAIRKRDFEADAQRADERRWSAQRGGVRSIGWLGVPLQVIRGEASVLCYSSQHLWANFLRRVERKHEIRVACTLKRPMGP